MRSFKVIIIGSGLSGNLLANGLINNGIDVDVYERLAHNAKREGYQIRLGASALMGLRLCLKKDQLERVIKKFGRADGQFAAAPILYSKDFKVILNGNRFPAYDKSAPISRKILRDILAEPVEEAGRIFYSKSFERYEIVNANTPDEIVRVHFGDGTTAECNVLIAADGAHSKINKQIGLNNLKTLTSHWCFLAKTDLPTTKYQKMSKELLRSPIGCMSQDRTLFFCAYLPDSAVEMNHATNTTYDESISSCFFGFAVPSEEVPSDLKDASLSDKWDFITRDLQQHWCPKYKEVIDLLKGSDLYQYQARVSSKPAKDWRKTAQRQGTLEAGNSRVMLMGDAMHAMLPNRGMGGNQALRDVSILLPELLQLAQEAKSAKGLRQESIATACSSYENEMIPRGFGWVQKSGGDKLIIADSNTWRGLALLYSLGVLLDVAYGFYWLSSFVYTKKWIDEAPELE